jgi:hypothetical protein
VNISALQFLAPKGIIFSFGGSKIVAIGVDFEHRAA